MLLKTTESVTVNNYPYGSLRATVTFSLEFNAKKGFRTVFQSINPKNNRVNAPKKSTYSPIIVLTKDEKNFVSSRHIGVNGRVEILKAVAFMEENFDLFTPAQIEYIYLQILTGLRVEAQVLVEYTGADKDKVLEILMPPIQAALRGFKERGVTNVFNEIKFDGEALEALKVPGFNPFRVKTYTATI